VDWQRVSPRRRAWSVLARVLGALGFAKLSARAAAHAVPHYPDEQW
jgi:hypothetical protein